MNESLSQSLHVLNSMPLPRKISMVFILILVLTGFAFMFLWANQEDYQVLYTNLSPEDGGAIVSKLKERNIPYKIEGNGNVIMVPRQKAYELRLLLAGDGLPNGGHVGFEIFDRPDFRTTKFVQELNYRRALQGELARTINQFKEVKTSRVFIVIPKEYLFVEDKKPASASIQLDLISNLPANKLAAIVHLVASAVEGLAPEHVTVVDTQGRVIFKGGHGENESSLLSGAQLDYNRKVEDEIRRNVQSMLEGIVGQGKAIVRVNAEIDFEKITLSEEEYDPSAKAVRSMRNIEESTKMGKSATESSQTLINQRAGVLAPSGGDEKSVNKKDLATNYEINRVTKTTIKPAGTVKRLSVAAVIDGSYEVEKLKDGGVKKKYIPRSDEELRKFGEIVKRAMGYNEDREDQVSVSSIPFSETVEMDSSMPVKGKEFDLFNLFESHKRTVINVFLVFLVFFLVVRPLLKGMKNMTRGSFSPNRELPVKEGEGYPRIRTELGDKEQRVKALEISRTNPEKAQQLIKSWVSE